MSENTKIDTNSVEDLWPKGSPTVSMDASLAALGKRLDFDLPAYNALLKQQGLSGAAGALRINFKDGETAPRRRLDGEGAYYHHSKDGREIRLYVGKDAPVIPTKVDRVNNTLHHETRHFEQFTKNMPVVTKEKARKQAIQFASALGGVAFAALGIKYAGLAHTPNEFMGLSLFTSPGPAFLGAKIGKAINYGTSPLEKDANKFAASHVGEEIFRVS